MDIVLVLLRLLHIVAAFAWVGLGIVSTFYITPAAIAAGTSGPRYLKTLFTSTSYGRSFAAASGLTVLAGILLYVVGNSMSHFSQTGNIVLGIGAAAGILAMIHGGAITSRATRALGMALGQQVPDGDQPVPADAVAVVRQRAEELLSHSRVSLILMIVALVGMGSARYL